VNSLMEQIGPVTVSGGQLCTINHEKGPRTKWLLYLEAGCENKETPVEVIGIGGCGNAGCICPWVSGLNVFVAPVFHGYKIEGAGICALLKGGIVDALGPAIGIRLLLC
jgi:hypothetical protein